MNINPVGLNNCQISNQIIPEEGPRSVPLILDFSAADSYDLDLEMYQQLGWFSMLQTIYADMADNLGGLPLIITVNGQTQQRICVSPQKQGYFAVLCPNPVKLTFACTDTTRIARIQLINVAIAGVVWDAVTQD